MKARWTTPETSSQEVNDRIDQLMAEREALLRQVSELSQQIAEIICPLKVGDQIKMLAQTRFITYRFTPGAIYEVTAVKATYALFWGNPGYCMTIRPVLKNGNLGKRFHDLHSGHKWEKLEHSNRCESREQFLELIQKER